MSAVPRRREAAGRGIDIARSGGHAPNPLDARREALEAIRRQALGDVCRSADETARLLELAAANPSMGAKPLLEAYGQGGSGPLRPLSWWRRNGCSVRKGSRGIAVSMFGGYVFGRNQALGPDPGGIGTRETPPNGLPDIGEPYAMAVLAARAGLRLRAVWSEPEPFSGEEPRELRPAAVSPLGGFEDLERALAAVRAYDATAADCISCDGRGCVLCSCSEERSRPAAAKPKPPKRSKRARRVSVQSRGKLRAMHSSHRIGRPPAERPESIAAVSAGFAEAARIRAEAERLEAEARAAIRSGIEAARADGYSLRDIAAASGLSLTRIVQLAKPD